MKLYISFEQETALADSLPALKEYPDSPYRMAAKVPAIKKGRLNYGYVTVSDGSLYDGPGAKIDDMGTILALIGPIKEKDADAAIEQQVQLLRNLGHEVLVCGKDY